MPSDDLDRKLMELARELYGDVGEVAILSSDCTAEVRIDGERRYGVTARHEGEHPLEKIARHLGRAVARKRKTRN